MKNNDEKGDNYTNSEENEDEDSFYLNPLLKIKNKNILAKKNNKIIKVKKNIIENSNEKEKEITLLDNDFKIKKDYENRICSVKIRNDPVWCVLSMKYNEYLSVGFTSGIIRILNQIVFQQKIFIEEHTGTIYSIYLIKKYSNCFLTSSVDKLIKKIFVSENFGSYKVLTILKGHYSSFYKAIELNDNQILSFSDDVCFVVWENINENDNKENYKNDIVNDNKVFLKLLVLLIFNN